MSFVEIIRGGTEDQRKKIISLLVLDGVAMSTIYAYISGNRRPRRPYRKEMCKHVLSVYKIKVKPEDLFPAC